MEFYKPKTKEKFVVLNKPRIEYNPYRGLTSCPLCSAGFKTRLMLDEVMNAVIQAVLKEKA
jgi:hypothetical protein